MQTKHVIVAALVAVLATDELLSPPPPVPALREQTHSYFGPGFRF